jgi:regulator of sigma E protease
MIYIVALAFVLGILIFVHELGHFLVAKIAGVKVLKFSLGFGPKLIGKKIGDTEYMISAFPLGGYVKLLGDNPQEKVAKGDEKKAFLLQPVRKRMAIVAAGPLANLLLAVCFFTLLFSVGIPQAPPIVGTVVDGFPAQKAGVQPGDTILKVEDEEMTQWVDLPGAISKSKGEEIQLTIKRGEETIIMRVTPRAIIGKNLFGEEVQTYQIGIGASDTFIIKREPVYKAVGMGFAQTWFVIKLTAVSVAKVIQRVVPAKKAFGGPILIAQLAGQQAQEGFLNLLFFTAVLSINLCLINLFPIPILDGGHLLFMTIEAIIGRPLSIKKLEVAQQVGLIILILLMAFIFYNDIMRLLPQGAK